MFYPSVNAVKQVILNRGPVVTSLRVDAAFQAYTGGVFNACANGPVNHTVLLVGWDDSLGTNGAWLLRNSWGEAWADNGYMFIEYGCSMVGYRANYGVYAGQRLRTENAFFDDFSYTTHSDPGLLEKGWQIRAYDGGPGPEGAHWNPANITFVPDPNDPTNRLMRLVATTNGNVEESFQAEIITEHPPRGMPVETYAAREFLEGTYAARVKFTDELGDDGGPIDTVIETFFTISQYDDDPYAECDFEYLTKDDWSLPANENPALFFTTWDRPITFPGSPFKAQDRDEGSHAGWHLLLMRVGGSKVQYYVDGRLKYEHTGIYYPQVPMHIAFQTWFHSARLGIPGVDDDGIVNRPGYREYEMLVDWVYFTRETNLDTDDVQERVQEERGGPVTPAPHVSSFKIEGGNTSTTSRIVTLNNTCTGSPTHYMAAEASNFGGASWQAYSTAPTFTLSAGNGTRTVYFKVKNASGESGVVNDSITLDEYRGNTEETIMLPGNVPLEMVWIEPGTFMMGRYPGEQDSYWVEDPQHQVTLAQGFWMGKYEFTKAQWTAVIGTTPWSGGLRVVE